LKEIDQGDPDVIDYQDIIEDTNKKARDIKRMSLDLKTRLLKQLKGG